MTGLRQIQNAIRTTLDHKLVDLRTEREALARALSKKPPLLQTFGLKVYDWVNP